MKCAITGHTQGLGLAFKDYFENKGYEVLGFTRRTGYDIGLDRKQIVNEIGEVEVFVNNACNKDNSQLELMIDMLYKCKYMIVTGSVSGDFPDIFGDDGYARGKERLAEACKYLTTVDDHNMAKILYLDLCFLDHSTKNLENPRDFDCDYRIHRQDVVNAVDFWFKNPSITKIEWNQKMTTFLEKELNECWPETSYEGISAIKEKVAYYKNYNKNDI